MDNFGTIVGGDNGGSGASKSGGVGVSGSGLRILNGGLISAGANAVDAIEFIGGVNSLRSITGASYIGNIVAFSTQDRMLFDGTGNGSFNMSQAVGFGSFTKMGSGTWDLTGTNNSNGSWAIEAGTLRISSGQVLGTGAVTMSDGTTLQNTGNSNLSSNFSLTGGATFDTNGFTENLQGEVRAVGTLVKDGAGTLIFSGDAFVSSATISGGTVQIGNGGTTGSLNVPILNNSDLAFNRSDDVFYTSQISGTGTVRKVGAGSLTLTGTNTYSGMTTVDGGVLAIAAGGSLASSVIVNEGRFDNYGTVSSAVTVNQSRSPGFLTSFNNFGTVSSIDVSGASYAANAGIVTDNVQVKAQGTFVNMAGGIVSGPVQIDPGGQFTSYGGSFGATTVGGAINIYRSTTVINGAFSLQANAYFNLLASPTSQGSLQVNGAAAIGSNTYLFVIPGPDASLARSYVVLSATGGRTGEFKSVGVNSSLLTATLRYEANDIILDLSANDYTRVVGSADQMALAHVLNRADDNASGDMATVFAALSQTTTAQGPQVLNAISGENYSAFSSGAVQTGSMFMNNFAAQAGGSTRVGGGTAAASSNRMQLASADGGDDCDFTGVGIRGTAPVGTWGVWGGAVGAIGSLTGNGSSGTTSYNLGGFAAGLDYQLTPELLIGLTLGYSSGTQWNASFAGQGWSNTTQGGLYASFVKGPFYLDGLAGYAGTDNVMKRAISIPGLAMRTANGSTGSSQFFGQVESGWRFDLGGPVASYVTPFARLQGSTTLQNGFTETGANSLDLIVASQTTNSLRTVLGAAFGGSIDLGWREKLALEFKLGWSREYASTDRPVTAAFAGAPALPFTTYGASPNRDGVSVGFSATAPVATATSLYVRYEGELSGPDNFHSGSVGVRMTF